MRPLVRFLFCIPAQLLESIKDVCDKFNTRIRDFTTVTVRASVLSGLSY